ncbi:ankyrin repeat protein [Colletotrichum chrysophilum]|uniref:Ankyrin repeat protein n=1 Tax=Colletotrichum chrysophilum TaxID=1836956 RepID=A0AAD9AHT3_9PEZI|nr:ankyrin repeat protein [Colletotrichum chrysophilum]
MSDPFSIASGVAGIVSLGLEIVKGLYVYCSTLKDQSSDIARIHNNLSHLHHLLENLRRQLDVRKFRSDDIIILACIEGRIFQCKECIEELKKVADKFERSQVDGLRAALKAKVQQATYPFQHGMLQKLEQNVDSIFQQVVFSLQLLQNEDTSSIRNHVEDTKYLLELHRSSNVSQDTVKWLNAPDATINFNIAYEKSQTGTGAWLINGQSFNTWLQQGSSFLWLYGFAGCGKSILCSTAIQQVFQHQKFSQDIGVAIFYFAFDDTSKQDVSALLRALILQLSGEQSNNKQQSNDFRSSLLSRLYDSYRNSTPRNQVLLDCLRRLCRSFKHTYIMIDALYESPRDKHRQDVLDVLTTMRGWGEPTIHLLVTSRDEVDIRDTLDPSRDESIAVRNEASNKDIALYITQGLRDKPQLRKWKGIRHDSKDADSDHVGSDDLFLDGHRPLAVFRGNRMLHDADAVLEVCPGFIEHYGFREANEEETLCVRIAHFSVQEYLKSNRIKKRENVAQYHIQAKDINTQAARICFAILDKFDESAALQAQGFPFHMVDYSFVSRMKSMFPWARYAASFWPDHFRESKEIPPEAVRAMLRFRPYALRISAFHRPGARFGYNPLQFATHLGLSSVVSILLDESNTEINEIAGGTTALIVAVNASNMQLARCFLDRDADVNGYDGGALKAAAKTGQVEMAKLLLDHGAEINAREGSALYAAAVMGHLEMAKLLLERGAEVNASTAGDRGAILELAIYRGNLEMAKLLLEGGADANLVVGDRGRTALWAALKPVTAGELEFVRLLLEYGAEVNHCNDLGETVLHEAAINHEDTVRLLLEHGADIHIADIYDKTALHRAAEFGNEKVAVLLLKEGADPNAVDKFGNTAVSSAAKSDCKDLVTFLSNF